MPEVVALTGTFANPAKNGKSAVLGSDIVNQLHDNYGFADPGTTEQADLSTFGIGSQQVDDLDTGLKSFNFSALINIRRGWAVNRVAFLFIDRT